MVSGQNPVRCVPGSGNTVTRAIANKASIGINNRYEKNDTRHNMNWVMEQWDIYHVLLGLTGLLWLAWVSYCFQYPVGVNRFSYWWGLHKTSEVNCS